VTITCHGIEAEWHCHHWLPRALYKITGRFHSICLFGRVYTRYMFTNDRGTKLVRHETEHVRQWREYGWRFPFAYVWAWVAAGFSYRNNRFEIEARAAEGRPC
jgi:hypothetical protein